jgi:hypothetical protein
MTKAELLAQNEDLWERVLGYEQTIDHQQGEITNATQQITAICEGLNAAVESNAQTRAMVQDVSDKLEGKPPQSPGWWN